MGYCNFESRFQISASQRLTLLWLPIINHNPHGGISFYYSNTDCFAFLIGMLHSMQYFLDNFCLLRAKFFNIDMPRFKKANIWSINKPKKENNYFEVVVAKEIDKYCPKKIKTNRKQKKSTKEHTEFSNTKKNWVRNHFLWSKCDRRIFEPNCATYSECDL